MVSRVFTIKDSHAEDSNGIYSEADSEVRHHGYFSRVIKYVPAEIIGAWVVGINLIDEREVPVLFFLFLFMVCICPFYINRETKKESPVNAWSQIIIGTIAFPIWALAIGDPCRSWITDYIYQSYNNNHTVAIVLVFSVSSGYFKQPG